MGCLADKPLGAKHTHLSVSHADRDYARTAPPTGQRVHVNRVEALNFGLSTLFATSEGDLLGRN